MSKSVGWVIISVLGFAASLSKFEKDWLKETPPLAPPLEQLRDMGRPISIICIAILAVLICMVFVSEKKRFKLCIPFSIGSLVALQLIFAAKNFVYGDISFAFQSLALYISIVFVYCIYFFVGLNKIDDFHRPVRAISYVGIIFIIANLYQAFVDIYPITFTNGWFLGTTGNPQHAAMLLVCTIPCYLFLIHKPQSKLERYFSIAFLSMTVMALFLTASRTGLLTAVVSIALFYREKKASFILVFLLASITFIFLFPYAIQTLDLDSSGILDKGLNNTRAGVWENQWSDFSKYPLFGIPLQGSRLKFAESSWLAVPSATGIIGCVPLLCFGFSCLSSILKLNRISRRKSELYYHCSAVMAGLSALLVGSLSEAYLLGILIFPVLALLQYLILARFIEKRLSRLTI